MRSIPGSFRIARVRPTRNPSDRVVGLLGSERLTYNVSRSTGLLDEASVELEEHLSMRIQLYEPIT
jgi:hypothetical protein